MTQIATTKNELAVQQNSHPLLAPPAVREEKTEIFKAVQIAFAKAMADLSHKGMSTEDLQYIVNELTKNIRTKPNLNNIRANEIPTAFANGVRGKYGEYFGLNVISGEFFIEKYLENDRLEIAKTLPAIEPPKKEVILTREDRIKFAKAAFEKFKFNDSYNDLGNIVYDFLDREGLIKFTTKEKFDVMNTIRQKEYQRLSAPTNTREKAQFEAQIQKMIDSNDSIIPAAKRECLRMFFANLKENSKELEFESYDKDNKDLTFSSFGKKGPKSEGERNEA